MERETRVLMLKTPDLNFKFQQKKQQLTQCEGDVITHAQQLPEAHRASIFVHAQLCNPAGGEQLLHHSNGCKPGHVMNVCVGKQTCTLIKVD